MWLCKKEASEPFLTSQTRLCHTNALDSLKPHSLITSFSEDKNVEVSGRVDGPFKTLPQLDPWKTPEALSFFPFQLQLCRCLCVRHRRSGWPGGASSVQNQKKIYTRVIFFGRIKVKMTTHVPVRGLGSRAERWELAAVPGIWERFKWENEK